MKFFLDTANIDEIKAVNDMGVISGVTTNPSLIAKEGKNFKETIKEIASIVDGAISGEVNSDDAEGMIKEGREIAAIHPNMVVKIPMTAEGLKAVKVLTKEGIKTKKESLMTPDDIEYMYSVLNNRYGIKTVQLTGGEPLLKENLKEIITNLKKHGANIKVTTNGYLLEDNMWIGEMVDKLNISLHSFDKNKYQSISTVENSYEKVISAVKKMRFKYPTLKISINTTLLRGINDNYNSIQELVGFASSIKADLKIIEVYPKNSKYYTSIYKIEPLIKQMGYKNIKDSFRKKLFSNGIHNIFLQRCTCSIISEQNDKTELCREHNDLYISQDGKVNLCRATNDTIDLYYSIKERDDNELASKIKKVYEEMGGRCICQVEQK